MKKIENEKQLMDMVISENKNLKGKVFVSINDFNEEAELFFLEITKELKNQKEYYNSFGLGVGEVFVEEVKNEKFYNKESGMLLVVSIVQAYIDSGSFDYFEGFIIYER